MEERVWKIDEGLINTARSFITDAVKDSPENVFVVYHGDGDGCCSAYFMTRFLKRLGVKDIKYRWVGTADFDFKCLERSLLSDKPNLSIFLDLPVYNKLDLLKNLRSMIFIYDHHKPGKLPFSNPPDLSKFLYINPVIHQNSSTPTTIFSWQLNGEDDLLNKEILFMGLYTESWLEGAPFFEDLESSHKNLLKSIARLIHSSFLINDTSTLHYALEFLLGLEKPIADIKNLEEIRNFNVLKNIYNLIQNEKEWIIYLLLQDMKKMPQPRYVLRRIDSRMRICGIVASELRWKYPDLVVGIWQRWKDSFYCELRRGKNCKVDLVDLIEELKKQVELKTGGGHPEAAAFTADKDNFEKAIEKLKEILKERMKKDASK